MLVPRTRSLFNQVHSPKHGRSPPSSPNFLYFRHVQHRRWFFSLSRNEFSRPRRSIYRSRCSGDSSRFWNVLGRRIARSLVTPSRAWGRCGWQRCAPLAYLQLTFRPSANLWWCFRHAPWPASWAPGYSRCEDRVPADSAAVVARGRRHLCSPYYWLAILRTMRFLLLVGMLEDNDDCDKRNNAD